MELNTRMLYEKSYMKKKYCESKFPYLKLCVTLRMVSKTNHLLLFIHRKFRFYLNCFNQWYELCQSFVEDGE